MPWEQPKFGKINPEQFKGYLLEHLPKTQHLLQDYPLQRLYRIFTHIITQAALFTSKKPRQKKKSVGFWTKELGQLRDTWVHAKVFEVDLPTNSPLRDDAALSKKIAKGRWRNTFKWKKREFFSKFLKEIPLDDIWRVTGYGMGNRKYVSPPLYVNGVQLSLPEEQTQAFAQAWFPAARPPPPLPDLTGFTKPTRGFVGIMIQEVQSAIWGPSAKKTSGISKINYAILRMAWPVTQDWIHAIVSRSITEGSVPSEWKEALVAVVPKPGKPSYDTTRSFRPISLLECISKVVARLAYESELHSLCQDQFTGHQGRGADDALVKARHIIQDQLAVQRCVALIKFNIKGFFDNIPVPVLIAILRAQGFNPIYLVWIEAFLMDRSGRIKLSNYTGPPGPTTGIPQGSPMSPVLASLFTTALCSYITRSLPNRHTDPVKFVNFIMYMDNGEKHKPQLHQPEHQTQKSAGV